MADYIYLQGADDVRSAGHQISRAASEMQQAASNIDNSLMNHQRFMDDWLMRFADVIQSIQNPDSTSEVKPMGDG